MATQFRYVRIKFDPTKGRTQREPGSVNFSRRVRRVGLALNGFNMKFTDRDRSLWEQKINIEETSVKIDGRNVQFNVSFLLRDASGRIDDRFEGYVDVLAIGETL